MVGFGNGPFSATRIAVLRDGLDSGKCPHDCAKIAHKKRVAMADMAYYGQPDLFYEFHTNEQVGEI